MTVDYLIVSGVTVLGRLTMCECALRRAEGLNTDGVQSEHSLVFSQRHVRQHLTVVDHLFVMVLSRVVVLEGRNEAAHVGRQGVVEKLFLASCLRLNAIELCIAASIRIRHNRSTDEHLVVSATLQELLAAVLDKFGSVDKALILDDDLVETRLHKLGLFVLLDPQLQATLVLLDVIAEKR